MKKLEKKVDAFLDSLKKDQSAFIMCANDDGEFFYASYAKKEEVAVGIAAILCDYFEENSEGAEAVAVGVIGALKLLVEKHSKAGEAIVRAIAPSAAKASLDMLKKLRDVLRDGISDNNDDDEDEDCSTCDANRVCPLPNAIKYRKANGIPAPKKRSNKRCNENEKGS